MSRHLLVPVDGSPLSRQALEFAFEEYDNASIVAFHVLDPTDPGYSSATEIDVRNEPRHGSDEWYERANEEEKRIFEDARELATGFARYHRENPKEATDEQYQAAMLRRVAERVDSATAAEE